MKLGLFGGSFDPIHLGHVLPVQEARRRLGLDRVVYLPTASPPHKQAPESAPVAPAAARYAMVEMAILLEEGLFASDHELRAGGPSYTVETLEHFREEGARAGYELDLHLLLGSDSFAELHTWRRWRELPELARLVVLARPDWEVEAIRGDLAPELRELLDRGEIEVVTDARVDVSSTDIRRRLSRGEPPDEELLPPLVVDYLQKYRFYR
ncbi:MAG TPA: nicotinate-nucleotide adenylyltransferase [Thermoanaerobaculia bacterium]